MPRLTGLQRRARSGAQERPPAVLSSPCTTIRGTSFEALKAGAGGYVLKREADSALLDAVRAVLGGEPFLTNAAERRLVQEWMADASTGPSEPLTPREQEVLKLIAEAHTNREIGELLGLAEKTVRVPPRATSCASSGMRDRVELVRYAIRRGPHRALTQGRRRIRPRVRAVTSQARTVSVAST
jgi:DNA-binding NarL/FixJ family response regulator